MRVWSLSELCDVTEVDKKALGRAFAKIKKLRLYKSDPTDGMIGTKTEEDEEAEEAAAAEAAATAAMEAEQMMAAATASLPPDLKLDEPFSSSSLSSSTVKSELSAITA